MSRTPSASASGDKLPRAVRGQSMYGSLGTGGGVPMVQMDRGRSGEGGASGSGSGSGSASGSGSGSGRGVSESTATGTGIPHEGVRRTRSQAAPPHSRAGSKEPSHLPLHRRLLFPTLAPDAPLPVLVEGASAEIAELNERLYHLIALALRAYVLSWYPRISRDRTLLPSLASHIVIPLLRPLLANLTDTQGIASAILIDLPAILHLHVHTYWQARRSFPSATSISLLPEADPETDPNLHPLGWAEAYHARLPLISVEPYLTSPDPYPGPNANHGSTTDSDTAPNTANASEPGPETTPYRQPIRAGQYILSPLYLTSLADALLRMHLPAEEYRSDVERIMAREIVGRVVLGAVARRVGEGWFVWSLLLKLLGEPGERQRQHQRQRQRQLRAGLERTGRGGGSGMGRLVERTIALAGMIWSLALFGWSLLVTLFAQYTSAPRTRAQYRNVALPWLALARALLGVDGREGTHARAWGLRVVWGGFELVVTLLGPLIDRLVPHLVASHLTPTLALSLVGLLERVLFPLPGGYPAPAPPDPTPTEVRAMQRRVVGRLREVVPSPALRVLCGPRSEYLALEDQDGLVDTPDPHAVLLEKTNPFMHLHSHAHVHDPASLRQREEERYLTYLLDPLGDPGCNAHLVALGLDVLVGVLEPGLVSPLPERRGSATP